jgi:alkyldihydroxyacetonephosphate synthase
LRRWNGWGDPTVPTSLPPTAVALLERAIGPGAPRADAPLDAVVASIAPSRPEDVAIDCPWTTDREVRLRHARGQSLPDWIALRSGRIPAAPDAVALPESSRQVHPDIPTAVGAMVHVGEVRDPDPRHRATYDDLYREVYRRMYRQLRPLYRTIRRITGYPPV